MGPLDRTSNANDYLVGRIQGATVPCKGAWAVADVIVQEWSFFFLSVVQHWSYAVTEAENALLSYTKAYANCFVSTERTSPLIAHKPMVPEM